MIFLTWPRFAHLSSMSRDSFEQNKVVRLVWLSTYGMFSGPRVSYLNKFSVTLALGNTLWGWWWHQLPTTHPYFWKKLLWTSASIPSLLRSLVRGWGRRWLSPASRWVFIFLYTSWNVFPSPPFAPLGLVSWQRWILNFSWVTYTFIVSKSFKALPENELESLQLGIWRIYQPLQEFGPAKNLGGIFWLLLPWDNHRVLYGLLSAHRS